MGRDFKAGKFPFWDAVVHRLYLYSGTGELDAGGYVDSAGLKNPDGTAAAPSITFLNDSDTGFFSKAANVIGIALGGVLAAALGTSAPSAAAATDTAGADFFVKAPDAGATAPARVPT